MLYSTESQTGTTGQPHLLLIVCQLGDFLYISYFDIRTSESNSLSKINDKWPCIHLRLRHHRCHPGRPLLKIWSPASLLTLNSKTWTYH